MRRDLDLAINTERFLKVGSHKPQITDFDFAGADKETVLSKLATSEKGLSDKEAYLRLRLYGHNEPVRRKRLSIPVQIFSRFLNPLVIVLFTVGIFSLAFGEKISAVFVFLMVVMSVFLSFVQEYRSNRAAEKLREMVHSTSTVLRNGKPKEIKVTEVVPGDILDLYAGDIIPADLRIIYCKDLYVNQSSLTGESFPVEKSCAPVHLSKQDDINANCNIGFMGSSVVSGTALGVVLRTGPYTRFGELSRRLAEMTVETNFEKGINSFTLLMIRMMIVLVLFIFAANGLLKGDWLQAFLFAIAVAVGLTPEMLPMIITVNLSKGAMDMARKEVIIKRLNSIQNFGAMDVLCTDKTGTLTLDKIVLEKYCDVEGKDNEDVLRYAYINSSYQTGLKNLLDKAILKHEKFAMSSYKKIDELPFDFERKMMSVVVEMEGRRTLISKGAPEEIFKRCTKYELNGALHDLHMGHAVISSLQKEYDSLSSEGFRVLAVASRDVDPKKDAYSRDDEKELVLKGYVAFLDPPKPTAKSTIKVLKDLGIAFKVLTGDNELVTKKICDEVGLDVGQIVTGEMIESLDDKEIGRVVEETAVFARLDPSQKEKVIRALHGNGHTVGYLGDGINDSLALKASDVGISVNNAVDVAKESADIILLKKSLMVLKDGVMEGRKIFGNIIKYIKMGFSSNFGNMLSMTGASIFLPFLPMTAVQILLNNFLYDLSQVAIPTDQVDDEYVEKPKPWNVGLLRRFMVTIGPISSIFDFTTFAVMIFVFNASPALFHTGWFVESLCTQTLVIYIIRTGKIPFIQSRPSTSLIITSLLIVSAGLILPFSPLAPFLGFVALPPLYFFILAIMIVAYLLLVYFGNRLFVRKFGYD